MLEDKVTTAFFSLLRSGLWDRPLDEVRCFPLSEEDWHALFQISVHQTVEGIVFDGIQKINPEHFPPKDLLFKWLVRVEKIAQRNKWMNTIIGEQIAFFEKKGQNPLLLKGQGLALCYLDPMRRVCGDIDWYFSTKEAYDKIIQNLENRGIEVHATSRQSAAYFWKGGEVDHHQRLFDVHNPFCLRYLRKLEQQENRPGLKADLQGTKLFLPSPIVQVLQAEMHILKHLLSFGIGIRQLCDVARLYATYQRQLDGEKLLAVYTKLKTLKWITLLHAVLIRFIGLSKQDLPFSIESERSADWMMEEILKSGNFGFYDVRYQKSQQSPSQIRTRTIQRLLNNFMKYVPYAPMEALSFPWVHFYSRLTK